MPEETSAIPDAAQRALALDTARSFIVEAPAGSGKTGLLIQRYLKLLAIVDDPAEVLAITFTVKATAEMQHRVLAQLTAARAGTPPASSFDAETRPFALAVLARDQALGWHLIDAPRALRIRTIDSVAADIARSLPILSGAGASLQPAEDAEPLYSSAAYRTLMFLGGTDKPLDDALQTLLLHRDGSLPDAARLIAEMLSTRDQWGELVPLAASHLTDAYLDQEVLPRLERALDKAICRALTRLTQLLPEPLLARLCALAAEMAQEDGYRGAPSPIALCRMRHQPPAERAEDLDHWRALIHLLLKPSKPRDWRKSLSGNHIGFDIQKNHQAELKLIIAELQALPDAAAIFEELCQLEALPPAQYPFEQWHVTKALFRVLARALVELQFVFAARQQCDFAELGLLARAALRRDSALDDLHTSAGVRLQHLLIDEMQDTSSAQYELIHLLTRPWDGYSQTVFLVGDPKQSIYLFRQARVERFLRTFAQRRLGELTLTPLHLSANFRSQSTLVRHFNDDFAQLFPPPPAERPQSATQPESPPSTPSSHPTSGLSVPFRPAHPMRLSTTALGRVWHAEALPYSKDDAVPIREQKSREQAALAAQITQRWRLSPESTIAVLVRNRAHLFDLVKAFKAEQIPYRAVEIEPLAQQQEILDLLALTRALLHPADRTAWLALLRAPWCGLALADLHALAAADSQTTLIDLIARHGDLLSADGIARLEPFWLVVQAALAQRGTLPLAALVRRTWHAFAAPKVLMPDALANAGQFFGLLEQLEQKGEIAPEELTRKLDKLYAAPASTPGAVDLMTIHKAKGLEWDVVFVPALEKTGRVTTSTLLNWLELEADDDRDSASGMLAPIQARGAESHQLVQWMRSIASTREAAERKRLFYVACTRAREELHLFAAPALAANGDVKPKADTLLYAAWPAAEPYLQPPPAPGPATIASAPQTGQHPSAYIDLAAAAATSCDFSPQQPVPQADARFAPQNLAHSKVTSIDDGGTWQALHLTNPAAENIPTIVPPSPTLLTRIPLALLPKAAPIISEAPAAATHARPEGSFAARSFGNSTHTFLDQLARQRAAGHSFEALVAELPSWSSRISAVLRASGLGAALIPPQTAQLLRALSNMLTDPIGQWLLDPHPAARSEFALTSKEATLRLDRTFLAGMTPGSTGNSHLWIVDYKTATHAQAGLDDFLAREKERYSAQLCSYALALEPRSLPIRVALYYPLLRNFIWGEPSPDRTIRWSPQPE